jgi:P27 family predicted phage terminase small subunit
MRRNKSTAIKLLEGNRGHRTIRRDQPHIVAELGAVPGWFNIMQRTLWDHAKKHCPRGMLRETDRPALTAYCVHQCAFIEAVQAMEGQPLVITQPSGRICENPLGGRVRSESQCVSRAIEQLGFSPNARNRVHVDTSADENEFDDVTKPARRAK